jgi:TonB family protein
MQVARLVVALLLGILFCHSLTAEQVPDDVATKKSGGGRFWIVSELDTMKSHKWIWMDESLKEPIPESLLAVKGKDDLPIPRRIAVAKYPEEALKRGGQADVRLRVLIDKKGNVRGAYILQDSGHDSLGFEETALEAAKKCSWQAAEGKTWSDAKWVTALHRFRLSQSSPEPHSADSWWSTDEEMEESLALPPLMTVAKARGTIESDGLQTSPQCVNLPFLEYPEQAKRQGKKAEIWVKVLIDESGKVARAEIIMKACEPQFGFEKSALEVSLKGLWKPSLLNGKPVSAWVSYAIRYQFGRP